MFSEVALNLSALIFSGHGRLKIQ